MTKHLWKKFEKHSLEDETESFRGSEELIIGKQENGSPGKTEEKENKETKESKKRTATTVHLEIRELVRTGDLKTAHAVLEKAFRDGFKGKRLDNWSSFFVDKEIDVGSSMKSAYGSVKKDDSKKHLTQEIQSSIITQIDEEKNEMIDIPDLPLEDFEEEEVQDTSLEDHSGGAVTFGIIGAGQAGGRIAESFYKLGYGKTLAVNTAEHDLNGLGELPEPQKVFMSTGTGGGAGKDMRLGEQAADKYQQEIYEKMQKMFGSVDRILVCIGGGGGTGSGSCLRLVETAKKYLQYLGDPRANKKVGVMMTLPTTGEATSPVVADNAHLLGTKLCALADEGEISPLIIVDNDKIKKMYPKLTVRAFWPTVNSTVTGLFHVFNVLAAQSSDLTSFDPADYNRVLSVGGCMIMGVTTLKEYKDGADVSKAIRGNLEKGLLCGGFDISTAKAAACIATAPAVILDNTPGLMNSFETGFDTLANITGDAMVFRGIYEAEKEKIVVYTALTGLSEPTKRLEELKTLQQNKVKKQKLY